MNWTKIIANIAGLGASEVALLLFVPEKYKEVAHLAILLLIAMANLFQNPPHKDVKQS